jgi:transcriptional regulator with XRE-family HTH domain
MDIEAFGRRVQAFRARAGLTQQEVADRADLNRVTLSLVERGQRELGITRAPKLADALGVSLPELFGTDG